MKKTAILLMALLTTLAVSAQDTVETLPSRSNYYWNFLPKADTYCTGGATISGHECSSTAKEMYVEDKKPITVYGVAAAMQTQLDWFHIPTDDPTVDSAEWWEDFFNEYNDTSTADLWENLVVWFHVADSL